MPDRDRLHARQRGFSARVGRTQNLRQTATARTLGGGAIGLGIDVADAQSVKSVVATARPGYKMAAPSARRPFGGRAITRDNMDVPAFMRKQMD